MNSGYAPLPQLLETPPQLRLRMSSQPTGRTRIAERRVSWPWSLPRGFYQHGPQGPLTVLPQCAAAGLLPGDRWCHELNVDKHASLRFIEAGATVVHSGEATPGEIEWRISVGSGGTLALFGQPFVLLPHARMHQKFDITLNENATAIISDGVCLASGSPDKQSWKSTLCVRMADGRPVLREAQEVDGRGLARLAAYNARARAFANIMVFAPRDILPVLMEGLREFVGQLQEGYGACGMLRDEKGICLRLVCTDGGALTRLMNAAQETLERRLFC